MFNKKYRLVEIKEFGEHNPSYDGKLGAICYPVYFKVGENGLFLWEVDGWFSLPHRVRTSRVKEVKYTDDSIIVTTRNTELTFEVIVEDAHENG